MRILIISLKYLGDVVIATPAIRAVQESFPGAHLAVAVRRGYEDVLAGMHGVHEIIGVPLESFRSGTFVARLAAQWKMMRELRARKFDLVIVLEPGDRETLFAWFSGAPRRVGPAYQPLQRLLTTRVPVHEESTNYIDYYCAIVEAAGARVRSRIPAITVSPDAAAKARAMIGAMPGASYVIGMHPGAREADRRWLAEHWAALIDAINDGATTVVLMSGPGERSVTDAIIDRVHDHSHILRADGVSIALMAALIQRCHICITPDSAPRHIAAAVGTRTVSIMPARSRGLWELYDPQEHMVVFGTVPTGPLVDSVTPEEVLRLVG